MKAWITVITVAGLIFTQAAQAQEALDVTDAANRVGGGFSLMLGGSFCLEGDEADCSGIDPGLGLAIGASYRFGPNIGLGADFFYGAYDPDLSDVDLSSMGLTAGPRVYLPIGPTDIVLGAGLGWNRISASASAGSITAEAAGDGLGLAFMAGIEYRVSRYVSFGLMGRINLAFVDEVCASAGGEEECWDTDSNNHNAMLGATLGFYF